MQKNDAMITNSWSRRQLTMITAAFLLADVIIDVICLHSASSIADPNQIGTNPNPDTR